MGIYSSGRPKKVRTSEGLNSLPHAPGEYRHRNAEGVIVYVGETNDINRRNREHQRNGRFGEGYTVEYKVADGRTTSRTRRMHEQQKIKQHNPALNKSRGGEGRLAKR